MAEHLKKKLAKTIKRIRKEEALTQRELAAKLGLEPGHIAKIENVQANVTLETLNKICVHLKCSVGYLFDEEESSYMVCSVLPRFY